MAEVVLNFGKTSPFTLRSPLTVDVDSPLTVSSPPTVKFFFISVFPLKESNDKSPLLVLTKPEFPETPIVNSLIYAVLKALPDVPIYAPLSVSAFNPSPIVETPDKVAP